MRQLRLSLTFGLLTVIPLGTARRSGSGASIGDGDGFSIATGVGLISWIASQLDRFDPTTGSRCTRRSSHTSLNRRRSPRALERPRMACRCDLGRPKCSSSRRLG